jgi:hypothetical protein
VDPALEENGQGVSEISESPELTYVEESTAESNEPKDNPAWNDALSVIPEEFHPHLKTNFSKWDKYTQEVQQSFAPYKSFAEQGVKPEEIQQALQFAHFLNTNPRGVFDFLDKQYNYSNANNSQGNPAEQQEEVDIDDPLANIDISKNPQFKQLAEQQQAFQQQFEAEQRRKQDEAMDRQVQSEIAAIQTNYPTLDPREVITRALGKQTAGITKDVDLEAAAKELQTMFGNANPAPSRGSSAPPVLGRSSLPSSQKKPSEMSREERTRYVAEQMAAMETNG